tara:strand:+ start:235 stop:402 length:168 start_codon:yes stop_codon:yes gene_type:complete
MNVLIPLSASDRMRRLGLTLLEVVVVVVAVVVVVVVGLVDRVDAFDTTSDSMLRR